MRGAAGRTTKIYQLSKESIELLSTGIVEVKSRVVRTEFDSLWNFEKIHVEG